MASATDDFDRANSADLGASWTPVDTGLSFAIVTNNAVPNAFGTDCAEVHSTVLSANHWAESQILVGIQGQGTGCGVMVRSNGVTASYSFYRLVGNASGWELIEFNSGSFVGVLASGVTAFADGDTIYLEFNGSNFTCKRNTSGGAGGATLSGGTGSDSTLNSNTRAGIAYSGNDSDTAVQAFAMADIAAGGTVNTKTMEDTIIVGDATVLGMERGRLHQDTILLVDDLIPSQVRGRLLQDSFLLSDDSIPSQVRGRLLESAIAAVTDENIFSIIRTFIGTDTLAVTDEILASVVGNAVLTKIMSSAIDVTDGAVVSQIRGRILQDTIIISEGTLDKILEINMVADDTIDVTDELIKRLLWTKLLGDAIGVTDEALANLIGQNIITKILTSNIDTFDEALRWANRFRLGESVVLTTDEIVKVMRFTREMTDAIETSDGILTAMQRFILLSDALSVQDDATAVYIPPIGPATYDPVIRVGFDQPRIDIGGRALV